MPIRDPSYYSQESDGFYSEGGYLSAPQTVSPDKPILNTSDINFGSSRGRFSVNPEDLIYVSDWSGHSPNPTLAKRNPHPDLDLDLFGLGGDMFGLDSEVDQGTAADDTDTKVAQGDWLADPGSGGGDGSPDTGGATGSTGSTDSTTADGNPAGTTASRDGGYGFDMAGSIGKNTAQAGLVGLGLGALSGNPLGGLLSSAAPAARGVQKDRNEHMAEFGTQLAEHQSLMDDYGGRHNQNNPEGGWGGGYGYGGFSQEAMDTAAAQSDAQAAENDAQSGGFGGGLGGQGSSRGGGETEAGTGNQSGSGDMGGGAADGMGGYGGGQNSPDGGGMGGGDSGGDSGGGGGGGGGGETEGGTGAESEGGW